MDKFVDMVLLSMKKQKKCYKELGLMVKNMVFVGRSVYGLIYIYLLGVRTDYKEGYREGFREEQEYYKGKRIGK